MNVLGKWFAAVVIAWVAGLGAGSLAATSVVQTSALGNPWRIVGDGAYLYLNDGDSVVAVPAGGGTAAVLYTGVAPANFTMAGNALYWIDPNGDRPSTATAIFRVPLAPATATPTAVWTTTSSSAYPTITDGSGITTDGSYLYTVDEVQGLVHRLGLDGSGLTLIGNARYGGWFDVEHYNSIVHYNGVLYIADSGEPGNCNCSTTPPQVVSLPVGGGSYTTLHVGSPFVDITGIAVGDNTIYVADSGANTVWSLPISGGIPTAVVGGAPFVQIVGVTLLNDALYVTDQGNVGTQDGPGAIYRVSLSSDTAALSGLSIACPASIPPPVICDPPGSCATVAALQLCSATAAYSDGSLRYVPATWSSSDPAIISIDTNGILSRGSIAVSSAVVITGSHAESGITLTGTATVMAEVPTLTASFQVAPASGIVPLTVSFTNNSTSSSSWDVLLTYRWDFGDGQTSTETHPTHTYSSTGIHVVTLTTTNSSGQTRTSATQTISVSADTIAVSGVARLRPQVIMGGFDPITVDLTDTDFRLFAVVRPGAAPIQTVQTASNGGGFATAMNYAGTYYSGDQRYETTLTFPRGTFPSGTVLGDLFGTSSAQFHMSVTDVAQQTHSFPNVEFGNHVQLTTGATSPATPVSSQAGIRRVGPQVLAAGVAPQLIDLGDTEFDVIAIVRAGVVPIQSVALALNQGGFSVGMHLRTTLPNGDQLFEQAFVFPRGSFPEMRLGDLLGTQPGQFSITVTDDGQQTHRFPELRWGNYPALEQREVFP
ncbi:MAG: PKD domain-containing protein [Sulfurisoma sp.]|nr:PKD domain-containing protein [Sulfurisoma sp.]